MLKVVVVKVEAVETTMKVVRVVVERLRMVEADGYNS